MIPINQVILGGGDPLLGNSMVGNSPDEQLQLIEKYKQNLEAAKQLRQQVQPAQQPVPQRMIWDEIDAEISPMTDEQKTRMLQDEDYVDTYTKIQEMSGEHFTESEAKYLVADMYHTENGRKYSGEKFDMHKAKEICERYRGILPTSVTVADVYVAINSQYHDYAELFKNWFGDGIEQKIVESAIVFWFKDADCKAENKVVEYLGEY